MKRDLKRWIPIIAVGILAIGLWIVTDLLTVHFYKMHQYLPALVPEVEYDGSPTLFFIVKTAPVFYMGIKVLTAGMVFTIWLGVWGSREFSKHGKMPINWS